MNRLRALIFLLGTGFSATAQGETLALADEGYREAFSGLAQVSGRTLTGVAYGSQPGPFDSTAVRLALGAVRQADFICVRLQSQDGLYWSENSYRLPPAGEITPSLEVRTAFARELARYQTAQIGIRALTGRDCGQATALVPALPAGTVDFNRLTVQLNVSGRRPTVRLTDTAGLEVSPATCNAAREAAAVAFNYACDLALPPALADGTYRLEVTLRGMTGTKTVESFDIAVARAGRHGT